MIQADLDPWTLILKFDFLTYDLKINKTKQKDFIEIAFQ